MLIIPTWAQSSKVLSHPTPASRHQGSCPCRTCAREWHLCIACIARAQLERAQATKINMTMQTRRPRWKHHLPNPDTCPATWRQCQIVRSAVWGNWSQKTRNLSSGGFRAAGPFLSACAQCFWKLKLVTSPLQALRQLLAIGS